MAEERKSGEPPGVVPLIIGGSGGTGGGAGRHRSLQTLSLKGIPEVRHDGFVSSLQALGFRVTKSGGKLVVPATADKDAIEAAARASADVAKHANGAAVKKVIVVPGRLVNVVV